jgi:hypothetical protein
MAEKYIDIAKEQREWKKNVYNDLPLPHDFDNTTEVSVLCTYAQVYSKPFKFADTFLFSYGYLWRYLELRSYDEIQPLLDWLSIPANYHAFTTNDITSFSDLVRENLDLLNPVHLFKVLFGSDEIHLTTNELRSVQEKVARGMITTFPGSFKFVKSKKKGKKTNFSFGGDVFNFDFTTEFERDFEKIFGFITGRYYFDAYGYCWFEIYAHYLESEPLKVCWVRETAIDYAGKAELQAWIEKRRQELWKKIDGEKFDWLKWLSIGMTALRIAQ